jgi:cobalt-zinc-cadmium efflux system outer membrane protein
MKRLVVLIFSILSCSAFAQGEFPKQDTVSLSIAQAEETFLKSNLLLLAQKYNVDATQALIMEAKLYPNPGFNLEQGAYNSQTHKWFETDYAHGEEAYQVSQLIVLSRKIHKQALMAETNYKLAEDAFYDLLRTLKLALRSSFYNVYYLLQTAKVYEEEITALKTIVNAYKEVQGKGYVAESEVVQVQAQLYSLQNEYQTLIDNINDLESQLRLLLQSGPKTFIKPVVDPEIINADPMKYSYSSLLDSAYNNRTDLMIAKDNLLLSQQTYSYQKALAVPDLTVGAGYDWHGGYIPDFSYINLGLNIPIFNRNQGAIKNAKILIDYNNTQLEATKKSLEEQVTRAWQKAIDANKLYKGIDTAFSKKFDTLANEMMKNYMKRNVSLLTFLSFYDSYKQNIVQLNTIQFNKINTLENLNFLTGTNFFNK